MDIKTKKDYLKLEDLEIYKMARDLSRQSWKIYESLNIQMQIIIGQQLVRSTDSVGANIAEGYGRFHHLDRIRFFYYSRASFFECKYHWISVLKERNLITDEQFSAFNKVGDLFLLKLNLFISAAYKSKENSVQG